MIYFLLTVVVIVLISYGRAVRKNSKEDELIFRKMTAISELANAVQRHCVGYQLDDRDLLCVWSDTCVTWISYYPNDYASIRQTLLSTGLINSTSVSTKWLKKFYFLMMCQFYVFLKHQIEQDLSDSSTRSEEFKKDLNGIWNTWKENTRSLMTE